MHWFQNAGNWLRRQLAGRYGVDALGRALAIGGLVLLILAMVIQSAARALSSVFAALAFASLLWYYYRVLSRDMHKRAAENRKFLALWERLFGWVRVRKECFAQRKDYAFFRCPSCRQLVRVPRGKGRIRITCRKCGFAFEKKT